MNASVYDITGATVGTVLLDEELFGIEPNVAVMHQALVRQQANARFGNHDTKTRGEVSGGGKKPYKQKGTGRARQGSTRSPQWKGGGTVWGPHPRLYTQSMPRKMRQLAIRSALSAKAAQVGVLTDAGSIEARTKAMVALLNGLGNPRSTLVVVPERIESLYRASGNISNVKMLHAGYLNMADLLKYERVLFTVEALKKISGIWGDEDYMPDVQESANDATTVTAPRVSATSGATAEATAADTAIAMDEDAELDGPITGATTRDAATEDEA